MRLSTSAPATKLALTAAATAALVLPLMMSASASSATSSFSLLPAGKTLACLAAPGKNWDRVTRGVRQYL